MELKRGFEERIHVRNKRNGDVSQRKKVPEMTQQRKGQMKII